MQFFAFSGTRMKRKQILKHKNSKKVKRVKTPEP